MRAGVAAALACACLAAAGCSPAPSGAEREAWAAELTRLEDEVAGLEQRLSALVSADPRRAGLPEVAFGDNEITLTLPVEVVDGSGDATVHLLWKGRRVARAVCCDLDVTERVSGSVIPDRYMLTGTLALAARDAEIVGTPRFPETKVKLRVDPSPETWRRVDALLASQQGLCGWVLERVDVKKILAEQARVKGFGVKLPLHKIKPFRFPAGLSESVTVRGRPLALDVRTGELRIDEHAVWVGAQVRLGGPVE